MCICIHIYFSGLLCIALVLVSFCVALTGMLCFALFVFLFNSVLPRDAPHDISCRWQTTPIWSLLFTTPISPLDRQLSLSFCWLLSPRFDVASHIISTNRHTCILNLAAHLKFKLLQIYSLRNYSLLYTCLPITWPEFRALQFEMIHSPVEVVYHSCITRVSLVNPRSTIDRPERLEAHVWETCSQMPNTRMSSVAKGFVTKCFKNI